MIVDVAAFVGPYPFRELPWHAPGDLVRAMDAVEIDRAWVGYLPVVWHQDPGPGNTALGETVRGHEDRLVPIPVVQPDLPAWEADLMRAVEIGAPAVRVWPMHGAIDPGGTAMREMVAAAAEQRLATVLTVRLEDLRQRHPRDVTPDLPAAAVRALARSHEGARLLVTHAGRDVVEEVHFGLTEVEAERVLWDVSWLWGPPVGELSQLVEVVGASRFAFGTGMPLRLPEATIAKLDLSELDPADRAAIESGNLGRWGP